MMWWYNGVMVWGVCGDVRSRHWPLDTGRTSPVWTQTPPGHHHTRHTVTQTPPGHHHTRHTVTQTPPSHHHTITPSHTSQCHTDTTMTPSDTLHFHTDTTNTMAHVTLSHGHHHDTITHVTRHILFCIRYLGGEVTNDPQTFFRRGASVSLSGFNNTDQRQSGLWKDFSKVFPVMAEIWEPRGAKRKWYRYGRKLLS